MTTAWIMGRKHELPNGHAYIGEPYIVFLDEGEAENAADLVERVSGERPDIVEASLHKSRNQ